MVVIVPETVLPDPAHCRVTEHVVPRCALNKMPTVMRKCYFELIRSGMREAAAAWMVGASTSCGSLWFSTLTA
jgi:hypothetical protein